MARPVKFASPRDAHAAGIATVHQELLLFPELTVAENIFLGQTPKTALGTLDWTDHAPARPRAARRRSTAAISTSTQKVGKPLGRQPPAHRDRQALSQDARVLIMDEPTAALAEADVQRLMAIVRQPARPRRRHRLCQPPHAGDLRARRPRDGAARRRSCRHQGRSPRSTRRTLVSMMVGRAIDQLYPAKQGEDRRRHARAARRLLPHAWCATSPSSCGAARSSASPGLVGSGRTETALTIFGITPGDLGRDPDRRQAGRPSPARRRRATSASPMCRRTAACRA